jgi:hypothetical protein
VTTLERALADAGITAKEAIAAAVAAVDDDYLSRAGIAEPAGSKLHKLLR